MEHDDDQSKPGLWRARIDLFDGIETSRLIVHQSRVLLELTESEGPLLSYDLIDD